MRDVSGWRIIDGPDERPVGAHDDFEVWCATLENLSDATRRRTVCVEIARTVRQSDPADLIVDVREAVQTNGRAAIEKFLSASAPPARIVVSSTAVLPTE